MFLSRFPRLKKKVLFVKHFLFSFEFEQALQGKMEKMVHQDSLDNLVNMELTEKTDKLAIQGRLGLVELLALVEHLVKQEQVNQFSLPSIYYLKWIDFRFRFY